jgi:hypothetical protein
MCDFIATGSKRSVFRADYDQVEGTHTDVAFETAGTGITVSDYYLFTLCVLLLLYALIALLYPRTLIVSLNFHSVVNQCPLTLLRATSTPPRFTI